MKTQLINLLQFGKNVSVLILKSNCICYVQVLLQATLQQLMFDSMKYNTNRFCLIMRIQEQLKQSAEKSNRAYRVDMASIAFFR